MDWISDGLRVSLVLVHFGVGASKQTNKRVCDGFLIPNARVDVPRFEISFQKRLHLFFLNFAFSLRIETRDVNARIWI